MCIIGGLIGGGIQGGLAALGADSQKKATKQALNAQLTMGRENNALARENRNILTGYINPYNQVGLNASNALSGAVAQGPYNGGQINSEFLRLMKPETFDDYRQSTGYGFRLGEGLNALQTGYAARGALQSGAAMKDVTRYGQNFASNEYQNWRNNVAQYGTYADQFANQERGYGTDQYNNWINLLGSQQNVGLSAVNALAGVNTNTTNQIINSNNQMSAAQSNAALAKGQANSQMYAGFGNALGNAAGFFMPGFGY